MAAELSLARELVAGIVLALQIGAVTLVAVVIARRLAQGDLLVSAVLTALVAIAQAVGVPLVLATLSLLSLPAVLASHLVLVAIALRFRGPAPPPAPEAEQAWWRRPSVLAAVAAGVGYFLLAADFSLGPPSLDTDTREYHITNLAHWLREGSLWALPFQSPGGVTATHPGNGELVGVWLALPSHGDELVYAMPALFAALAVLAGALLGRELRADRGPDGAAIGALAVFAALSVPLYFSSQLGSLSTDVVAAACTMTALALLVTARRTPSAGVVVAAGVALGLAVGSKYTALVPGAAVTAGALVLLPRRRMWWWLVPGVVVFAVPWFLRNLLATGNPLFPQAVGPLTGGDLPLDVIATTVATHILERDGDFVRRWFDLGVDFVGPIAVAVAVACALAFRRGPQQRALVVTSLIAMVSFVAYLAVPFSGGGPDGLAFVVASSMRYALTSMLIGAVLLAAVVPARVGGGVLAVVLAWNLWRLRDHVPAARPDLGWSRTWVAAVALVALAVALALAMAGGWRGWRHGGQRWIVASAAVAGLVLVAGGFAAFHRLDRGTTLTGVEQAMLAFPADQPVIVVGVGDLRSLLGPRLERPLLGVSRGGNADEVPFIDRDQIRRHMLDDAATAPPAPTLAQALDAALAAAPANLLAIGADAFTAYPDGWSPDDTWCSAAVAGRVTVYTRCRR